MSSSSICATSSNAEYKGQAIAEYKGQAIAEQHGDNFVGFPLSSSWDSQSALNMEIQIDDIVVYSGMSLDELVNRVEAGSLEYTYKDDFNLDALISAGETKSFYIYCNDVAWIKVKYGNHTDSSLSAKDCIVVSAAPTDPGSLPYSRFLTGKTVNEMIGMSLNDIKADLESCLPGIALTEGIKEGNPTLEASLDRMPMYKVSEPLKLGREYIFKGGKYIVSFSKNDSTVIDVTFEAPEGINWN